MNRKQGQFRASLVLVETVAHLAAKAKSDNRRKVERLHSMAVQIYTLGKVQIVWSEVLGNGLLS